MTKGCGHRLQERMEALVIRDMRVEDFSGVSALLYDLYQQHHEARPDMADLLGLPIADSVFDSMVANPDRKLLMVESGSNVAGVALALVRIQGVERTGIVQQLVVAKPYRRQGIGSALMDALEAWMKERGIQRMELNVWTHNAAALAFYQARAMEPLYVRMAKQFDARRDAR